MSADESPRREAGGPTPPGIPPIAPGGVPVWIRVLLVASLAANLLVVGIVAGALFTRHPRDSGGMRRDLASAIFVRELPPERRLALEAAFRDAAGAVRIDRQGFRAELAAALAALRAEPFDPAALAGNIAAQRGRLAERTALGDRLFLDQIAAMTPAEREAYADRIEAALSRPGRWRRD